jgi:hypothetical protein
MGFQPHAQSTLFDPCEVVLAECVKHRKLPAVSLFSRLGTLAAHVCRFSRQSTTGIPVTWYDLGKLQGFSPDEWRHIDHHCSN